ncbi:uncharacterized protein KY384_005835 [Bacidia gigantensis]|uniref:uncharacterized protein n=1 Tax=Bacidia gigantensis TaxID=2732470 RepID=UPI001D05AC67|nr:uncharacterized protein KY384_005835 [Bacidia gigantensis]KAG8529200.1 hypothetical protein KY384_005835 [Bacidia gigantensis]
MAHFLRGKQAGIQKDFSAGLDSRLFAIDEVARYGVNSQVSAIAYDPVQSILAVGTNDSKFGSGQIYVFGRKRVTVTLRLPRKASVKILQFCSDKLVAVDNKNELSIFSLLNTRILTSYSPSGSITALATDPTLDYALIGLQNGEVLAYDMDRQNLAPWRIPSLWKEQNPRARPTPVVTLAFHPRHIGNLLVGYADGAIVYSFQQNKPSKTFQTIPSSRGVQGSARLTQAIWHPTGTFVLIGHEDSTFVIWDVKEGRQILARTLDAAGPGSGTSVQGSSSGTSVIREPIFKVAWCAKENPDDTGLLVAGGRSTTDVDKGLNFLELGATPVYATSSWQALTDHFVRPKRQFVLPSPPNAQVVDFCLIPRKTPHFAGASDPIAVIALLASGEMVTMSFPSGHPITPTNQLHVSLTYVHPFVDRIAMSYVDRTRWLGLVEKRLQGPPILKGGAEAKRSLMRFSHRNILHTAHADGTIRLYDAGHGDDIENEDILQVDVARAVGRYDNVEIVTMSMSGATGELAVGLRSGEVSIFRWDHNQNYGRDIPHKEARGFGLEAIQDRAEPGIKEGLSPLAVFDQQQAPVTTIKMSDVGFVCAGFESGAIVVIDLRGPAVIFETNVIEVSSHSGKKSSFRRSSVSQSQATREWPTIVDFGVMSLEGENYSSILLFVGTNTGNLLTFKLLPESSGGYAVKMAGLCHLSDRIISIHPINIDTGGPADAAQEIIGGLRSGTKVNGDVLVITSNGAHLFRPPSSKGAHKSWDTVVCYQAAVARFEAHTYALVGVFGDGTAKAFSIPGLKEIASADISTILDIQRLSEAIVTPIGYIFGWIGPSEVAVLNVWGTGQDLTRSLDRIFNPELSVPPRPTISNLQWISGTTHVTPADMDKLIGGPDRPPSKRMLEQMRADEIAERQADRQKTTSPSSSHQSEQQQEGYWAYMQRQIQERTENLGLAGDSMDKLEDNSSGFANDVNKFVRDQKKAAVKGYLLIVGKIYDDLRWLIQMKPLICWI